MITETPGQLVRTSSTGEVTPTSSQPFCWVARVCLTARVRRFHVLPHKATNFVSNGGLELYFAALCGETVLPEVIFGPTPDVGQAAQTLPRSSVWLLLDGVAVGLGFAAAADALGVTTGAGSFACLSTASESSIAF
jgi:hypothetical protein